MSEDMNCFRCHREMRWYGIGGQTGVGAHIHPPVWPNDDCYLNNTISICLDCLKKTSLVDAIQEVYRIRQRLESAYPGISPCPIERKCCHCHGNIILFYQDVTINFCDPNQGNNVDYCSRCYPKVFMDEVYQAYIDSIPQFLIDCQKWRDEHPEEMARLEAQFAVGSD